MMCEVCRQKTANVIFKTVTDGQLATRAMCMECAQNLQHDMYRVFMALGLGSEGQPQSGSRQEEPAEKPKVAVPSYLCTRCGRPFETLDEHTMAGCAHCYDAMEKGLRVVLEVEKAPEKKTEKDQPDRQMELKYQLMEAVMKEDYEAAAHLRDEISAMENAGAVEGQP
ncbi:MAG: hypothetical protein PHP02_08165 [Eubacteriales bacterium]|nr:hypothetical protein [Eubacteriales bacterium]